MRRIVIARCILGKPGLLVLAEGFNGLETAVKEHIVEHIYNEKCWTILDVSRDTVLLRRSQHVYALAGGKLAEHGTADELYADPQSIIHALYPRG